MYKKLERKYKKAGSVVDGRKVLSNVDNMDSIGSTLYNYTILNGIRVVSMSEFDGPKSVFYAKNDFDHSKMLAEKIKESNSISPLIIVIDDEGPYILEGSHRYVALYYLKAKSFPALIVVDDDEYIGESKLKTFVDILNETKTVNPLKLKIGQMKVGTKFVNKNDYSIEITKNDSEKKTISYKAVDKKTNEKFDEETLSYKEFARVIL